MKHIKVIRISLLIAIILAIFPLYFMLRPSNADWKKVKEITKETYKELQETDEMYADLPFDAQVTEIYVKLLLGDAKVSVYVTVPEKNINDFALWLNNAGKQYNNKQNIFNFYYFVGDSNTHFGDYEKNNVSSIFGKVYWSACICLLLFLLMPIEKILKNRNLEQ